MEMPHLFFDEQMFNKLKYSRSVTLVIKGTYIIGKGITRDMEYLPT